MITNRQLRNAFLNPQMKYYFDKKLSPLPSDEIDSRIEEALKYLNMVIHCNGDIPVSREVDEVWHYWILETAEYEKLCAKLHGGMFLHHSSNDYAEYADEDAKNRRIDLHLGISILSSYVLNYGPFAEDRVQYWPLAVRLMERFDWTLSELNEWLGSAVRPPEQQPQAALATLKR